MNGNALPIGVWLAAIAVFAIAGQTIRNELWRTLFHDIGKALALALVIVLAAAGLLLLVTL